MFRHGAMWKKVSEPQSSLSELPKLEPGGCSLVSSGANKPRPTAPPLGSEPSETFEALFLSRCRSSMTMALESSMGCGPSGPGPAFYPPKEVQRVMTRCNPPPSPYKVDPKSREILKNVDSGKKKL